MKKTLLLSVMVVALVACGNRNKKNNQTETATPTQVTVRDTHNASNSLSYAGTYEGTIPCADCPGIDVVITLDYDGNYTKKFTYQERKPENVFTSSGKFTWNAEGNVITLTGEHDGEKFRVVENAIVMLDKDGKEITGDLAQMYRLGQSAVLEQTRVAE